MLESLQRVKMKSSVEKFESLYSDNRDDLFIYIIRSMHDENTASDILQDTFLNFFKHFDGKELLDDRESRMYLFRIARNLMINHTKTAYMRKVDLTEMSNMSSDRSSNPGPESQIVGKIERDQQESILKDLLAHLNEEERTAVVLRFYHEMKLDEIAEILDVSISSASRLVRKSIERMTADARNRGIMVDLPDL